MARNREGQGKRKAVNGNWKVDAESLVFHFLSTNGLSAMPRRRREIRGIEPLKAKELRDDVLEREISHFCWRITNDLDTSTVPGSFA
jgi:hypothetical protein